MDRDEREMAVKALGEQIVEALEGRRHSPSEMLAMEPLERFKEYCGWHLGDPGWGTQLAGVLDRCRRVRRQFDGS